MHKVISFGIPSYNAAKDMDHCITSILEGSNYATDIEIIIVDDGSAKDNTLEKAQVWESTTIRRKACLTLPICSISPPSRAS